MRFAPIFAALLLVAFASPLAAQNNVNTSEFGEFNDLQDEFGPYADLENSSSDYNAHRYNLILDAFERPEEWRGEIARSEGVITLRRMYNSATQLAAGTSYVGTPRGADNQANRPSYRGGDGAYENRYFEDLNYPLTATPDEVGPEGYTLQNQRVLGVNVDFFRRGVNTFAIYPPNPVFIEGVAKGFEVYVLGRNARHELYIMLRDMDGNDIKLFLGNLNFQGWQRMRVVVPPQIDQVINVNGTRRGLYFTGFYVVTDIDTSYGSFYMYFDNLSVLVDRFWEETQDPNEPLDVW